MTVSTKTSKAATNSTGFRTHHPRSETFCGDVASVIQASSMSSSAARVSARPDDPRFGSRLDCSRCARTSDCRRPNPGGSPQASEPPAGVQQHTGTMILSCYSILYPTNVSTRSTDSAPILSRYFLTTGMVAFLKALISGSVTFTPLFLNPSTACWLDVGLEPSI